MKLCHITLLLMAFFRSPPLLCHCLGVCAVNKRELIGPTVLDIGALSRIRPNERGKTHTYRCTYYQKYIKPNRFVSPNTLSQIITVDARRNSLLGLFAKLAPNPFQKPHTFNQFGGSDRLATRSALKYQGTVSISRPGD